MNTVLQLLCRIGVAPGLDKETDRQLLRRFAVYRDEAAFAALLRRHGPLVWDVCRAVLHHCQDAEDAFQATFLALARHTVSNAWQESVSGWLHDVAYRVATKARVAQARRRAREERKGAMRGEAISVAAYGELSELLHEELRHLPEKYRCPLVLCYLEGQTRDQAARQLGCSLRTLDRRLADGREWLRRRLTGRGISLPIALLVAGMSQGRTAVNASPQLLATTAKAAAVFAMKRSAVVGVSAQAVDLAEGVLRTMIVTKLKLVAVLLTVVMSLAGGGVMAYQALAINPSSPQQKGEPTPGVQATARAEAGRPQPAGTDCFGDPLPQGALARFGTLRLRHVGPAVSNPEGGSVVFSRNGKMLFTACPANPIRLWDRATGKLLRSFGERNVRPEVFIVLSPDENILAAINGKGSVSLWEVATGKLLRQLVHLEVSIHALAFSRDGRILLSAGEDNAADEDNHCRRYLRVWEAATGKVLRDQTLRNAEKAGELSTFIFSPDGKTLASIHRHNVNRNVVVYLWEAASGKELYHLPLGKAEIPRGAIAFSPDSRFLAVSSITWGDNRSDGAVHLWEAATGKEVRKWTLDKAGTCSLAFSPDGKILATGSAFGPIRLWEVTTGKELRRCQGYRAHVVALAFSPDSSTLVSLAGRHDHTARLWEVASGKELTRTSRGHVGSILSVAFSPDGKSLISEGRDGLVCLWNPQTGQEQRPPLRVGDFQALAALSADGKTLVSIGNSFSPNYQNLYEVVAQTPTQICVWDQVTGQKLRQFPGPVGTAQSLALSPDGKILILRFVHSVHLMEVATGKEIRWFAAQCCVAALSPDGKTLAVARDEQENRGTVYFYATATGKDLGSIKAQGGRVGYLAFSSDGQTLAAGGMENTKKEGGYTIRLWRARADKEWKEAGKLLGHQNGVWGLTFSPDGKTLASASADGTLRLWEIATGQERRRFAGHSGDVWCLAFALDGRRLAAGGNDTAILVWDVTGRLQNGQLGPVKLSAQEVKNLWAGLADTDAARAGQAIWTLAAAPAQTIPLLREYLRPVASVDGKRIARLITDLDNDTFAVRQRAMDELAKLGEVAEPALRQALAKPDSLDMRRRLEQLLESLEEKFPLSSEKLRSHRALEVLGQIGTPEALSLLETLAHGEPGARLTLEAQAILKRLGTRVNGTKP